MSVLYTDITSRNIGILSKADQNKLKKAKIAIAGVGGIGGLLAERLIRMGVGKIRITDPGKFDVSNFNRQYGSNFLTINKQKARVVAKELGKINPQAKIEYDSIGITSQQDADRFVLGVDLVIDEMDYGLFNENLYLQKAARDKNIYYMFSTALGFGALVVNFNPKGITLESYNDFQKKKDSINSPILHLTINNIIPHYPSYLQGKKTIVTKMIKRKIPVSSCSIGVGLASIITANEAINIILKKTKIITAPKSIYIDLMDRKMIF